MSLTGLNKTNSSVLSGIDKTSATLYGYKKSGQGWEYDQPDITYDMTVDNQGRTVSYDGLGSATTLVGLDKTQA